MMTLGGAIDGLVDEIYYYLWKKDPLSGEALSVRLPDTIIYKYDMPSIWYFTSKDGSIKFKHTKHYNKKSIQDHFLRRLGPSQIVATFISSSRARDLFDLEKPKRRWGATSVLKHGKKELIINIPSKAKRQLEEAQITFEYLDLKTFSKRVLTHQMNFWKEDEDSNVTGYFRNSLSLDPDIIVRLEFKIGQIQVIWSPKLCLFERRQNIKPVSDTRFDVYERAVTFDGKEYHSKNIPVKGVYLTNYLERVTRGLANHIAGAAGSENALSRAVFHFKIDSSDRVWFLYCSSLRLASEQTLRIKDHNFEPLYTGGNERLPPFVRANKTHCSSAKPVRMRLTEKCPHCQKRTEPERVHEVSNKMLLHYHQSVSVYEHAFQKRRAQSAGRGGQICTTDGIEVITVQQSTQKEWETDIAQALELEGNLLQQTKRKPASVFERIYPNFSEAMLMRLKEDPVFLTQSVLVCEDCFLNITKPISSFPTQYLQLKDVKSHFKRSESEKKSRMEQCLSGSAIKGVLEKIEKRKKILSKRKFLKKRRQEEEHKYHATHIEAISTHPSVQGLIRAEDQNIKEESFVSGEREDSDQENEYPYKWKSLTSRKQKEPSIFIKDTSPGKKAKTSTVTPSGRRIAKSHSVRELSNKVEDAKMIEVREASRDLYNLIRSGVERKTDLSAKLEGSTTLPSEARSRVASRHLGGGHSRTHTETKWKRAAAVSKISEQGHSVLQEMRDWHRDLSGNECHTDRTRSELERSVNIYLPGKERKLLSQRSQALLKKPDQFISIN